MINKDTGKSKSIIKLDDVGVTYSNKTQALRECSLEVEKGEFVFVVGHSGSGKSTLIKVLLGNIRPTSGNVMVDGLDVGRLNKRRQPFYRRRLGVVFQEFKLLYDRTVYENVALAQRVIGVEKNRMIKNVLAVLKMVGIEDKAVKYPGELSGGEQQRVAIARAMVNRPGILLADEPTGNLDPQNSRDIMNLLNELNKLGTTVIVVTHDSEIVDQMKKRVITLKSGVVVSDEVQGGYAQ